MTAAERHGHRVAPLYGTVQPYFLEKPGTVDEARQTPNYANRS